MQLWRPEFELDGINSGSEREIVQQLCAKQYVAWK